MWYLSDKRREELKGYAPYARFQLLAVDPEGHSLISFLGKFFEKFAEWADPRNSNSVWPHYEADSEGATGGLWINNEYAGTTKLFLHDGNNPLGRQGITIRDHLDLGPEKVEDVFRIAAKFEEYLQLKGFSYERYNMKFPERQEVLAK